MTVNFADRVVKRMNKVIRKSMSPTGLKKSLALTIRILKARTRKGYGVTSDGGKKEKFKPLEPSTKTSRGRKSLHYSTSKNRSNLTETGQMIKALTGEVTSSAMSLFFKPDNRTYIGKPPKKPVSNTKLAFLHDRGSLGRPPKRPWLRFSKEEKKQISKEVADILRKEIRKEFNR